MTFERLGSFPCSRRGRRMSHSMPFTPTTTTRGFGFVVLWFCARTGVSNSKKIRDETENLRKPMGKPHRKCRQIIHATPLPLAKTSSPPSHNQPSASPLNYLAKAAFNPLFTKTRLQFGKKLLSNLAIVEPMPRKAVVPNDTEETSSQNEGGPPSKVSRKKTKAPRRDKPDPTQSELMRMTLRACLIARDATFNIQDLLTNSSRMAFLAIRDCEKELDQIERSIDEQLPGAITRVNERRARQLLACLKCITDLERIGDLVMSVAHRVQARTDQIPGSDVRYLIQMAAIVHDMLDEIHRGFAALDVEKARKVLRSDSDLDHICHTLFQRHLVADNTRDPMGFEVLLMAQALERSGDHAKNLAEELYSLIEGDTLRHSPKRTAAQ